MTKAALEPSQTTVPPEMRAQPGNGLLRGVRLLGFLMVVGMAILAQALEAGWLADRRAVIAALPVWFPAQWIPWRSLREDVYGTAQWLALVTVIGAALLMPWWRGEQGRRYLGLPAGDARLGRIAGWSAAAAVALGLAALWLLPVPGWGVLLWGVALLLFVGAGVTASRSGPGVRYGASYAALVAPHAAWIGLPVLLVLFVLGYGLALRDLPPRLDEVSAQAGLAAVQWVAEGAPGFFFGEHLAYNVITLALPALLLQGVDDRLLALRLAGAPAALLLLTGVWLVACELFRRTPVRGVYDEVIEDDGRWPALLAVLITGAALPLAAYARVPLALDGAFWGVWGVWALLRGLRLGRSGLLAGSGVAFGLALYTGPVGLWMLWVGLLVWTGCALLERAWLVGKVVRRSDGETVLVQRGAGRQGVAWWAAGAGIAAAPLLQVWITAPQRFAAHWQWEGTGAESGLGWQLERAVRGLIWLGDQGRVGVGDSALLPVLLVPVLLLTLGALLLNLDRLVGWVLSMWLAATLVGVSLTVPALPDWAAYAGALPALGLTLAFGLDRLRVLILETLGTWTLQATVYLALGLVLLAGFFSSLELYNGARRGADLPALVGVELARAQGRPVVLAGNSVDMARVAESATVRFLDPARAGTVPIVGGSELATLVPGTRVLVAPSDWALVYQLRDLDAMADVTVLRDIRATPTLLIVELSPAPE